MESDLIVDIDDTATVQEEEPPVPSPSPPDTHDDTLPEIEIDEWIDLEDQWEKDYFFSVYTDDELYHYAYALYYAVLNEEATAQHLAQLQVRSLKDTLARMRAMKEQAASPNVPPHLIPIFRGMTANLSADYENYKRFYERALKMPYAEGQRLLAPMYLKTLLLKDTADPLLTLQEPRREMELMRQVAPAASASAPAAKTKAKKRKTEPPAPSAPATVPAPVPAHSDRIVVLQSDQLPLPIEGLIQTTHYPAAAVPNLSLKERVEYDPPTVQERIPIDQIEWRGIRGLTQTYKIPFDTRVLETLTELPSIHELRTHLEKHGYDLETLTPDEAEQLHTHLETLAGKIKTMKTGTTRYVWTPTPVSTLPPSERSPFRPLESWLTDAQKHLEAHRDTYQNHLGLLEKQSDTWTQHPAMTTDIYELTLRIRRQQIDLEEAIAALQSHYKDAKTTQYVDFLRGLLSAAPVPDSASAIEKAMKDWNRMDQSIRAEKHPLVQRYEPDLHWEVGHASYRLEDQLDQRQAIAEDEAEAAADADAEAQAEDDMVLSPDEPESAPAPPSGSAPTARSGPEEVWEVVRRMLQDLQTQTELPAPPEWAQPTVPAIPMLIGRRSLLEAMREAFPDLPEEDLKTLVIQRLSISTTPETEKVLRQTYKDLYADYKKTIVEVFLYALTGWVIYLQDQFVRQGRPYAPAYIPCLPVWAFYGIPMSSNDDKGIARYLVCAALSRLENEPDHPDWVLLRSIPEKKCLDRISKYAQLPEYTDQVQYLKEQWKARWKEIARKEKDLDIRVEALEKATDQPKEYLKLYIQTMLHLPRLLSRSTTYTKAQTMVAPVANSCCLQPLYSKFQPFGDFKEAGLYSHTERLKQQDSRSRATQRAATRRAFHLGRILPNEPPRPSVHFGNFFPEYQCAGVAAPSVPALAPPSEDKGESGVFKYQWNDLCRVIGKTEWEWILPAPSANTGTERIGEASTSHIRRVLQEMLQTPAHRKLDAWLNDSNTTWEEKIRLMVYIRQLMNDERQRSADTLEPYLTPAMAHVSECLRQFTTWTLGAFPDAPHELLNYTIFYLLTLPAADAIPPRERQRLIDLRLERMVARIHKRTIPTAQSIQDYYATVREKLKLAHLAEYKSLSIQEIQELQDAKRLKLKKIYDQMGAAVPGPETEPDMDASLEAEGLAEHRAYATWNGDDADPERLDL